MRKLLFYLDRSIYNELSKRNVTSSEEQFFTDMASSHLKGKCFLCGDSQTLSLLAGQENGIPGLAGIAGNCYGILSGKFFEQGLIIQSVSKIVILTMRKPPEDNPLSYTPLEELPDCLLKDDGGFIGGSFCWP